MLTTKKVTKQFDEEKSQGLLKIRISTNCVLSQLKSFSLEEPEIMGALKTGAIYVEINVRPSFFFKPNIPNLFNSIQKCFISLVLKSNKLVKHFETQINKVRKLDLW